jgi:diguanylate cyclase (GGDEF)-like protein
MSSSVGRRYVQAALARDQRRKASMRHATKPHRVLMVEDSPAALDVYCERLKRRGYSVSGASSAEDARRELSTTVPDIVLLDVFMPGVSGFDLLREMRNTPRTATIPVILTSALTDTKHIVEGLSLGANDYVTKPIVMPILAARMEGLLRSSQLVKRLEVQTELLSNLAAFDELTGVYNRRSLFHHLEAELSRCERYGRSLSLLMLDVDHFKHVNDHYGHLAGDAALRSVAATLQSILRVMDLVCRYGGEEFCVILPETNETGAYSAAERLRSAVERQLFSHSSNSIALTVSIGVASWVPAATATIPDLLARADEALLEAKQGGRNQVRLASRLRG